MILFTFSLIFGVAYSLHSTHRWGNWCTLAWSIGWVNTPPPPRHTTHCSVQPFYIFFNCMFLVEMQRVVKIAWTVYCVPAAALSLVNSPRNKWLQQTFLITEAQLWTHTHVHAHMHTHTHACTHTWTHLCMHTHTRTQEHACTYMNRDTHRHDREGNAASTEVMSHCTLDPYNNGEPFSYRTLPIPNTHTTIHNHTHTTTHTHTQPFTKQI